MALWTMDLWWEVYGLWSVVRSGAVQSPRLEISPPARLPRQHDARESGVANRIQLRLLQSLTLEHTVGRVEAKHLDRGPPDLGQRFDPGTRQTEVPRPCINARIEQPDEVPR